MKTIKFTILSIILICGCAEKESDSPAMSRIKLIEHANIGGYNYRIIQIDSIQYLTYYGGGTVKLEKP